VIELLVKGAGRRISARLGWQRGNMRVDLSAGANEMFIVARTVVCSGWRFYGVFFGAQVEVWLAMRSWRAAVVAGSGVLSLTLWVPETYRSTELLVLTTM